MELPALKISRKSGNERFSYGGVELNHTLADFWKWAVSDLVSNATRGILAEFIVASAFGKVSGVRKEWDAYDLKLDDETKIEVKSTAYLQSWAQKGHSRPEFSIKPSWGWDAETNLVSDERRRQAQIYVFCLFAETVKSDSLDPMDLDKWEFIIVSAKELNERFENQKKISLTSLAGLKHKTASYGSLACEIGKLANELRLTELRS